MFDVKMKTVGAGSPEFDSQAGQIRHGVVTAATFLRSCVAQVLSGGYRLCSWLYDSA